MTAWDWGAPVFTVSMLDVFECPECGALVLFGGTPQHQVSHELARRAAEAGSEGAHGGA